MIAGQFATPDGVAAIEAKLGLHDPMPRAVLALGSAACCAAISASR